MVGRVQGPMAGNCFRRFWWWLPIVILSGCFPSEAGRLPCTSIYPSETARDELPTSDADVIIFLGDRCDGEINVTEIQDHLEHASALAGELSISVMPRSREYRTLFDGITYLMTARRYRAVRVLQISYRGLHGIGRPPFGYFMQLQREICARKLENVKRVNG